jgi:hypothetical membrane protein
MDFSVILQFICPELFILVIFLWCLGLFLKKAPWFKQEWAIPFVLLAVSVVITLLYMAIVNGAGFTGPIIIIGIIQAVLIAAVAVFGNEIIKQVTIKRQEDQK